MAAASGVPSDTKFRACRLQQSVHERHVGINAVPRWSHQPAAWVPARKSARKRNVIGSSGSVASIGES